MIKWIISGFLTALTLIFASLKSVWAGFIYLGIVCLSLLCLYWVYLRGKLYIKEYHINFDKEFSYYKADVINTTTTTREEFEENLNFHIKAFKKLLRKDKLIDIFKILFILSVFAVCIIAML